MALSDPAVRRHPPPMTVHVWPQEMEPEFPLSVVEYTARGDSDPMHSAPICENCR